MNESNKEKPEKAQLKGKGKRPTIQILEKQLLNMQPRSKVGPSTG